MANKPSELSAQQKAERGRAKTRSFKMQKLDPYINKEGKHDVSKVPGFQFGRGTE